jgi:hypothetical protein
MLVALFANAVFLLAFAVFNELGLRGDQNSSLRGRGILRTSLCLIYMLHKMFNMHFNIFEAMNCFYLRNKQGFLILQANLFAIGIIDLLYVTFIRKYLPLQDGRDNTIRYFPS